MPKNKKAENKTEETKKPNKKGNKAEVKTAETQKPKSTKNLPKIKFTKKQIITALVLLALLTGFGYLAKTEILVAMVNGKPITRVELITELEKRGGTQTLDALITQELIEQEAKKQNIQVTQQEIDAQIEEIKSALTPQGITLEQALSQEGLTMSELRSQLILQIQVEKMVEPQTLVTDEEVQKYMEENAELYKEQTPEQIEQVKQALKQNKQAQATSNLVTQLRENAKINYYKQF